MNSFLMEHISLNVVWCVQFLGAVIVAVALPRAQWRFKVLFGLSALADVLEALTFSATSRYFYLYWNLRIVELNWLLYATCSFSIGRIHLALRQCLWFVFLVGVVSTVAVYPPKSNDGMQIWQVFMLMLSAMMAIGAYCLCRGLKWMLLSLAAGLLSVLQLACTLLWRHWRYDSHMWMITWIVGMGLLLVAGGNDRRYVKAVGQF